MSPARRVLLTLGLVLAPATARAGAPDLYGFGSREIGMGGAAAAETRGFAANYYNPAALVRSPGLELSLGYFHAANTLQWNGKDAGVANAHGLVGGLVVPGRIYRIPVAFGLALHLPDDELSSTRSRPQDQPRWELYDTSPQQLYFAANVAVKPLPWLCIGGGLSFLSATKANLEVTGSANVFKSDDSQLRHSVDADLTAVRYPQVGVRIAPRDDFALAAVYRGQYRLGNDLGARLAGDVAGLTTALYQLESNGVSAFQPQAVVLGGSWSWTKRFKTTFDATWIDYSAYVSPAASSTTALAIPPPAGGWPAGITPPTTPAPVKPLPLALHDRVVPHVGLEWEILRLYHSDVLVRAGYEFDKTPFDRQTGLTTYVDRDRHVLAFGMGYRVQRFARVLPGTLAIDGHAQMGLLDTATTLKTSPADYVGDFTAGGHFLNLGLTATFAFDGRRR